MHRPNAAQQLLPSIKTGPSTKFFRAVTCYRALRTRATRTGLCRSTIRARVLKCRLLAGTVSLIVERFFSYAATGVLVGLVLYDV